MRKLRRILTQSGDSCYAFAIAGIMEYKLGIDLNPQELHNYMVKIGRAIKTTNVLDVVKERGMQGMDGKYYKIKGYTFIPKDQIKTILLKEMALLAIDLELGEPIEQRMDKKGRLHRRQYGFHAVVGCDIEGLDIFCANSWGPTWGTLKNGYFYIPPVLDMKTRPFILNAYTLNF